MSKFWCFETYSSLIFGLFMGLVSLFVSLKTNEFFVLALLPIPFWTGLMVIRSKLVDEDTDFLKRISYE